MRDTLSPGTPPGTDSSVIAGADYVIIGAGSAGCVLANRLSANPDTQVVVLEAGGTDQRLISRMPSAFYLPLHDPRLNWGFSATPAARLNGRRLACPRGRGLGGSSSINGMVYVRGHAQDFERWQHLGATGWGYDDVLPYFKKSQTMHTGRQLNAYQGHDGPLATVNGKLANPLYHYFLQAANQAGYAHSDDLNGEVQEGFGLLPMTVDRGWRASTAHAYLRPASRRRNLRVLTNCQVQRIDTSAARPVAVAWQGDRQITVPAAREVILSAGAIQSPQLLMLSGIGPGQQLQAHGIDTVADRPGVGQNLMDHLEVYVQQACSQPVSLQRYLSPFGRALIGLQWLTRRTGLGATNHFEVGGFIRSSAAVSYPDIQFHFLPVAMSYDGSVQAAQHGFQLHTGPMLSASRGAVRLNSPAWQDPTEIDFNYMSNDEDWQVFRTAIRKARHIFAQPALDSLRGAELAPGADRQTDAELDEFIRAHAESAYHPCGTCRMGSDADAVVDPQGRVQGVARLRVVDASIFPHITNGNLNAPVIMAAEKLADSIISDQT